MYRAERSSANCRNYPNSHIASSVHPDEYVHCNGSQLRLTDSDLGSEQYSSSDYYVWLSQGSMSWSSQLLFIFPTRVNLATITLHYYSSSVRSLPGLRFWAVPDDFDVWDAPLSCYSHVDVAAVSPSEESVGLKNISISFNFNTKKVLMYKFTSTCYFAMSEVEFFQSSKYFLIIIIIIMSAYTILYSMACR